MLVDSHCHLDKLNYQELHTDVASVVENAKKRGVNHMLSVGVNLQAFPAMLAMIEPFDNVFASCGVHPLDLENDFDFEKLAQYAASPKVIAIGETGLDFYYQTETAEKQKEAFRQQIRLAIELQKPLIIHTRMAREETIQILREENAQKIGGVLHCFTENYEMAKAGMDLGFYISISGIVTFKKAVELQDVVKRLPLDRLLVETDSPYLAPIPYRGKENQPAYVKEVADYIADLKNVSSDELAKITTGNFFQLFSGAKK